MLPRVPFALLALVTRQLSSALAARTTQTGRIGTRYPEDVQYKPQDPIPQTNPGLHSSSPHPAQQQAEQTRGPHSSPPPLERSRSPTFPTPSSTGAGTHANLPATRPSNVARERFREDYHRWQHTTPADRWHQLGLTSHRHRQLTAAERVGGPDQYFDQQRAYRRQRLEEKRRAAPTTEAVPQVPGPAQAPGRVSQQQTAPVQRSLLPPSHRQGSEPQLVEQVGFRPWRPAHASSGGVAGASTSSLDANSGFLAHQASGRPAQHQQLSATQKRQQQYVHQSFTAHGRVLIPGDIAYHASRGRAQQHLWDQPQPQQSQALAARPQTTRVLSDSSRFDTNPPPSLFE